MQRGQGANSHLQGKKKMIGHRRCRSLSFF
jgi:hypothetical protein